MQRPARRSACPRHRPLFAQPETLAAMLADERAKLAAAHRNPLITTVQHEDGKSAFWFDCLRKCAKLLELPDETPIPTGVVEAVAQLVGHRNAEATKLPLKLYSATEIAAFPMHCGYYQADDVRTSLPGLGRPVAEIVTEYGDPEEFASRELKIDNGNLQTLPFGTKLYAVTEGGAA